jgi:hypothetical protein
MLRGAEIAMPASPPCVDRTEARRLTATTSFDLHFTRNGMSEVNPESIARNVCVFASAIATDWPRRKKKIGVPASDS